jgi:KDO2-lipid IV(A) lauroyltransferase
MAQGPTVLGFFADQHAGRGGARLPFLGRECSTSLAPAVFALRYRAPLYTAVCYRTGLAQWRVEVGEQIPIEGPEGRRSSSDIMRDVNAALEVGVRRDPANWFWVHNRWKPERSRFRKRARRRPQGS